MKKTMGEGHVSAGETGFSHTLSVEGNGIRITAELPGISEEMIRIDLDEEILTISVNGRGRRFQKAIDIPFEARLSRKRFSGGVLELFLEKAA